MIIPTVVEEAMTDPMNTSTVEQALRRLGELLEYHTEIELLLVGGAAGMITGLFDRGHVTFDCDVMDYAPKEAMGAVEQAAELVANELGLAPDWLNSHVQLRTDALPNGWRTRQVLVGVFGKLRISAASRPDLIAMKVLAGRDQDIGDLQELRVREDDVEFVRRYLDTLAFKGTTQEQISDAYELLDALELYDEE